MSTDCGVDQSWNSTCTRLTNVKLKSILWSIVFGWLVLAPWGIGINTEFKDMSG